jgi:pSer/pThr/pTyr-binding forkhead associated (FHA) protein
MIILLLLLPDGVRKEYNFEANSGIKIGSSHICDVVVPGIDKIHCTLVLFYEDSFYYLLFDGEILGSPSSNGIWVNNKRIFSKYKVKNQDIVTFSENSIYPHLILFPDGTLTE